MLQILSQLLCFFLSFVKNFLVNFRFWSKPMTDETEYLVYYYYKLKKNF